MAQKTQILDEANIDRVLFSGKRKLPPQKLRLWQLKRQTFLRRGQEVMRVTLDGIPSDPSKRVKGKKAGSTSQKLVFSRGVLCLLISSKSERVLQRTVRSVQSQRPSRRRSCQILSYSACLGQIKHEIWPGPFTWRPHCSTVAVRCYRPGPAATVPTVPVRMQLGRTAGTSWARKRALK